MTSEAIPKRKIMKWRDKLPPDTKTKKLLGEKLRESGLAELSEDLLEGSLMPNMSSQPSITAESQIYQLLSPELIQRCAEDFKDTYRTSLCQIRSDPLNPATHVQFENINTNLVMIEEHGGSKRLLDYSDLLNLRYNGKFPRRLMVQGEAGAGKTTFCAKVAWDWINGKYFQEFEWVIIFPLRKYKQQSIGEIAKSYLSKNNPVTATQLTEYMRSNTDKVFIVFDGLDEFAGNLTLPKEEGSKSTELQSQSPYPTNSSKCMSKEGNKDSLNKNESTSMSDKDIEIGEILRSEKLKECPVMVTTRPWRAKDITRDDQLQKIYRFIYVEGFSKENISAYIHRYFCDDEAKANDLNRCVGDNDVMSEIIAPIPIFIAMLCLMWNEFDDKRQEMMRTHQTLSQILKEMLLFLKERYAQKLVTQSYILDDSLSDHLEEIDIHLKPIASLALNDLLSNTLVFTVDEFEHCKQSMETACRVGVLSQENSILSRDRRRNRRSRRLLPTVFFPHKLFQEFMAGMHLAFLYESDNKEYNRLMTEVVVPRKEEFRYLLYFTSSESQAVGIDVMTHLLRTCRHEEDRDFLVDVAFESQDSDVAALIEHMVFPVNATLQIDRRMTAHTIAGYAFVGRNMDCFPQISTGNLKMNSHQREIWDSLLHSLTTYQGSLLPGKTSLTSDDELTSHTLDDELTSHTLDDELTSKIPTPGLTWTCGYVDSRGKDLSIPSYGFILSIPPGALEEGSCELIKCEALSSLPDNLKLNFDDLIVSPGFQCFPPGLKFKKPVKLTIPHCAVFNYPSRVRTVLISTDGQHSGKVLRTPLPRDACAVNHSHFELLLHHFSWACVIQVADASALKGKCMLCMPFLPKIMPATRKLYLEVRLRNIPHDPALKEARTDYFTQPMKDEEFELFVENKNLELICQFDGDDQGKPQSQKISKSILFNKTKHQMFFHLDFNGKENETPVKLRFIQCRKSEELPFQTRFAGVATSSVDHKEQSQPSSSGSNRPNTRSRKRKADCTCTQSHNIRGPPGKQVQITPPNHHRTSPITTPGGASIAAGTKEKSKLPRKVSESEFLKLSRKIGPDGFNDIGNRLGNSYEQCEAVLVKRLMNYPNALMELFMKWNIQRKRRDIREELARKLEDSELGMLADELRTGCLV